MKKGLFILLIFCFSLIVFSCSDDKEEFNDTDTTSPVIAEVTAVTTPTKNTTPNYTFSSTEAGTITYGGSCSSSTTSAISGNNTITLTSLSDGTYSDCTIIVKDSAENTSNTLSITSFVVLPSYVTVGNSGTVIKSSDGTTWSRVTATYTSPDNGSTVTPSIINDVTYGNGTFVVVNPNGIILTSSDVTSSWTKSTSGTSNNLNGVTYGNSTFVTVGDSGTILTSSNGTSWFSRTSGTSNGLNGVIYTE